MNLEEYEDVLAAELPNHLSSNWRVSVTNFGAAAADEARVAAGEAVFDQPAGTEDSAQRSRVMSVDEAVTAMTITFHSEPQASRSVFANIYNEVRATCRALNKARDEFWSVIGMGRVVDPMAESPTRAIEITLNVEAQTGVGA